MEKRYTIGVDFGTRSARAVLAEVSCGAIAACEEAEYLHGVMEESLPNGQRLGKGWALQHPDDYIEALVRTVRAVLRTGGVAPDCVVGIGIDFTSCTLLPVDKQLTPLCRVEEYAARPHAYAKLWKHHAAWKETDFINELLESEDQFADVLCVGRISSELLLPKILQMLYEDPQLYTAADQILEAGDWLGQLITGCRARSANMAAYKAMWDRGHGYPPKEFLKKLSPALEHLAEEKLAGTICLPGECVGCLNTEWAERLGLTTAVAVSAAIIDSHANVAGCGLREPGQMMLALGTSSVQIVLEREPCMELGIYGAVRDAIVPGYYAWETGIAAVGDTFSWFAENLVNSRYEDLARRHKKTVQQFLAELAGALEPGRSGLLALDWWNGNKTPFVDAGRQGVLTGCTLNTRPEEIYRALIEATAYGTRFILETFERLGSPISEVYACGGIVGKNPVAMQIYADVLGRELILPRETQVTALGAAMYAAVAAGAARGGYDTITEAAAQMAKDGEQRYLPIGEHRTEYDRLFAQYCRLQEKMGPQGE